MSNFLLVVPSDWTELDWEQVKSVTELSGTNVLNYINGNMLGYIEQPLKDAGIIPQESTVVDAKLVDDAFFMVKLG